MRILTIKLNSAISIVFLLLITASTLLAQNDPVAGDFRSVASGNWNDYTTWEIFDGASWENTTTDQIPNQNSAVFLEAGLTVTLTQDGECKNLFINEKEDVVRFNTQDFNLNTYGKLSLYLGSVTDAGGISAPVGGQSDPSNPLLFILTGTSGSINFVGSEREIIAGGEFGASLRLAGWTMGFALDSDAVGTVNQNFRAGKLIVSSGTLDINDASRVFIDMTSTKTEVNGSVIIKSGAVVRGSRGFFKSNEAAMESFTIEPGGKFLVRYTSHTLAAQNLNLNGTYGLIGNIDQNFSAPDADGNNRIGASLVDTFSNLEIDLSGQKYLRNDIVVNDTLFLKGSSQVNLNGHILSYGIGGSLEYSGSVSQITSDSEFPDVDGPANLIINNSNHVALHAFRSIEGDLFLNKGRFSLGNNNFTIGENSLSVSGTFSSDNMVLIDGTGILQKNFFQASSFEFPIGEIDTGTPVYTPVNISFSEGTFGANAVVGVSVTNIKHPNDNSVEDYLSRYWTINGTDLTDFEYDIEASYLEGDINGQEEDISSFIYSGGVPNILARPDISENKIIVTNIGVFGDITGSNLCDISNNNLVSVSPTEIIFCKESGEILIDGSSAQASGTIGYSWEMRMDGGAWETIAGEVQEDILLTSKTVAGNYDFRRITTTDLCDYSSLTEIHSFTVLPEISANSVMNDGASTICVGTAPGVFTGTTPEGGDNTYAYTWQQRKDGGSWEEVGVNNKNYQEGELTQAGTYEYRRLVTSGPCSTPSESNYITLTVESAVSNNEISTDVSTFCGSASTFTISGTIPAGGNGIYTYSWERRLNGGSWNSIGTNEPDYSEEVLSSVGTYEYRRLVKSGSCVDQVESNIISIILTDAVTISGAITDAIDSNNDGSIILTVAGGTAPYAFNWSNGATTQNIENIAAGTYTVTVTDDNGCEYSEDFVVDQITGLEEDMYIASINLYPNPTHNYVTIDLKFTTPTTCKFILRDNIGNNIKEWMFNSILDVENKIDLNGFPEGIYFITIEAHDKVYTQSIILEN